MRIGWQKVWRQVEWLTDKWSACQQTGRKVHGPSDKPSGKQSCRQASSLAKLHIRLFSPKKTIKSDFKLAQQKKNTSRHCTAGPAKIWSIIMLTSIFISEMPAFFVKRSPSNFFLFKVLLLTFFGNCPSRISLSIICFVSIPQYINGNHIYYSDIKKDKW